MYATLAQSLDPGKKNKKTKKTIKVIGVGNWFRSSFEYKLVFSRKASHLQEIQTKQPFFSLVNSVVYILSDKFLHPL